MKLFWKQVFDKKKLTTYEAVVSCTKQVRVSVALRVCTTLGANGLLWAVKSISAIVDSRLVENLFFSQTGETQGASTRKYIKEKWFKTTM